MQNTRSSYLISKNFQNFLMASVLTMLSMQLASTADGMIVGRFVSPDALSGVNALLPVNMLMTAIANVCGLGAGIRVSRLMGKRDVEGARRAFSTAVITLAVTGIIMTILLALCTKTVCGLLIDNSQIVPHSVAYMRVSAYLPVFMMLGTFFCSCIEVEGKPRVSCTIVLTSNVINIFLDIVFVYTFKLGVGGAALATLVCYVTQIVLAWFLEIRKSETCRFSFKVPGFFKEFIGNLREGIGNAVSSVALAVMAFLLISIINNAGGTAATNTWSILINILMLLMLSSSGISNAVVTLGSRLVGERDYTGMSILYRLGLKVTLIVAAAFTVVLMLIPGFLLRLFGASTEMMAAGAIPATRIFSIAFVPLVLVFFRQASFTVLQYYGLSAAASISMLVFIVAGVWIAALISPAALWWGFSVSLLILNVVLTGIILVLHKCKPNTSAFTLIPRDEPGKVANYSIAYTKEALSEALEQMHAFMDESGIQQSVCNRGMLLIEELTLNILTYASKGKDAQRMDVRIIRQDEEGSQLLIISLQDDGKPFNPTLVEQFEPVSLFDQHFGLRLVNHLGANINYRYMYGQNVLVAEFKY